MITMKFKVGDIIYHVLVFPVSGSTSIIAFEIIEAEEPLLVKKVNTDLITELEIPAEDDVCKIFNTVQEATEYVANTSLWRNDEG